jgi:hypothetical protein
VSSTLLVALSTMLRTGSLAHRGALVYSFETLFQDESTFRKLASSRPTVLIVDLHSENPNRVFSCILLGNSVSVLADELPSLPTDHSG